MTAPILVTGGTGTLGRLVVEHLRDAEIAVRVTSRHPDGTADGVERVSADLLSGEGVDRAVEDVATIIHCAGDAKHDAAMTRVLVNAAKQADVRHLVFISVVGASDDTFGYYRGKLASEKIVAGSGLGWTILRATQFHDLILTAARALTRLPVVPAPAGFRFQPIDADVVARRLVELAAGDPIGWASDMAGPEILDVRHLLTSYLRAVGRRRPIVSVPFPGRAARQFRQGINLAPEHRSGGRTWGEFLNTRLPD